MHNLVPKALFPAPKAREKRPGDEVGKCTREKCGDSGLGKFWKSIEGKQMISNVLEWLDGVHKLSYEQTSGVFNFIQRN